MHPPPIPTDEDARLAELRALAVLDSAPEPLFDSLARMASAACGTPIALVSLVDAERLWFKANVGLPGVNETPRDIAFCAHAICGAGLFEVGDALRDDRFADNPLVGEPPHIRFYAGVPLQTPGGHRVGTLCVIDRRPRRLDALQSGALRELAAVVTQALTMRRELMQRALAVRSDYEQRLAAGERFVRQVTDHLPVRIAYVDRALRYRFVNETLCEHLDLDRGAIVGRTRAELTPGAVDPATLAHAHEALRGRAQRYEHEEQARAGRRRIEEHLVPDVDADGTVLGYFASGIDITERSDIERSLRELTAIFEATTDFVLQTDRKGRVVYMNPALRDFLGLEDGAPRGGHHVTDLMTAETAELYRQVMLPALAEGGVWTGQSVIIGSRRRAVPVSHLVIAHRDERGRIDRYSAVMRDISDLEQARQTLALQADTLGSIVEAVPAMVAVVGADLRFRFTNRSFEQWAARPRAQIVGSAMADVLGDAASERAPDWVRRALDGETVHHDAHFPDRTDASHLSISLVPLRLSSGAVDGFVVVAQDITRHKREAVRLLELAQRDVLTGLLNRAGLEEALQALLQPQDRGDVALLYIDLDRFKEVNDEHGHAVGDELLRQFGQRLRNLVRPTDAVARLGGDEFALALAAMQDIGNAYRVADKVVDAAARPFASEGRELHVGASVGVAFGLDHGAGWADLLRRADAMLYEAKAAGRGRIAGERR